MKNTKDAWSEETAYLVVIDFIILNLNYLYI